jgi:hypothetical protein
MVDNTFLEERARKLARPRKYNARREWRRAMHARNAEYLDSLGMFKDTYVLDHPGRIQKVAQDSPALLGNLRYWGNMVGHNFDDGLLKGVSRQLTGSNDPNWWDYLPIGSPVPMLRHMYNGITLATPAAKKAALDTWAAKSKESLQKHIKDREDILAKTRAKIENGVDKTVSAVGENPIAYVAGGVAVTALAALAMHLADKRKTAEIREDSATVV